jgi:hypothetical protein
LEPITAARRTPRPLGFTAEAPIDARGAVWDDCRHRHLRQKQAAMPRDPDYLPPSPFSGPLALQPTKTPERWEEELLNEILRRHPRLTREEAQEMLNLFE